MSRQNQLLILLQLFLPVFVLGQKQITTTEQIWLGNANQVRTSEHWGVSSDLLFRSRQNYTDGLSQASIRLGAVYYFNTNARIAGGYAFVGNTLGKGHSAVLQSEHTPWQQFSWTNKHQRLSLNQSLRLEERFRQKTLGNKTAPGYTFNYRGRYNLLLSYALSKKPAAVGAFDAVVYNEVYVNFGKQIIYNTFDQYRVFAGLNYHVTKKATLQAGYVDVFQQLPAPDKFRKLHVVRVYYLYNLDLRKKQTGVKPPTDISFASQHHASLS